MEEFPSSLLLPLPHYGKYVGPLGSKALLKSYRLSSSSFKILLAVSGGLCDGGKTISTHRDHFPIPQHRKIQSQTH